MPFPVYITCSSRKQPLHTQLNSVRHERVFRHRHHRIFVLIRAHFKKNIEYSSLPSSVCASTHAPYPSLRQTISLSASPLYSVPASLIPLFHAYSFLSFSPFNFLYPCLSFTFPPAPLSPFTSTLGAAYFINTETRYTTTTRPLKPTFSEAYSTLGQLLLAHYQCPG